MSKQFKHIEGTGKPLKVVSPIDIKDEDGMFTLGNEYPVTGYWSDNSGEFHGWGFFIEDDLGNVTNCLERNCGFLDNKNWIVTERAPE